MPDVEITEARKPLASPAEDRAAFAETFTEGADASQFVEAAAAAAHADRGDAADRGGPYRVAP
jgi:hypothetical protein